MKDEKIKIEEIEESKLNAIEIHKNEIDYSEFEGVDFKSDIQLVIKSIEKKFLEREILTRIAILAVFSQKNIFFIGEPGTGKTAFSKVISKIIKDSSFWEMQFSNETKESDLYADNLFEKGTIATSDILFFDEMFKATPTLLNKLLPVLNERYVTVNGKAVKINARSAITTSNELPSGTLLNPFMDRLHFMFEVLRIQEKENRRKFILNQFEKSQELPRTFTHKEADYIKLKSLEVEVSKEFQDKLLILMEKTIKEGLKCTDRKYGHTMEILKVSAFLNNRNKLNASDLFIFQHIGWTTYNERSNLKRILYELMFGNRIDVEEKLATLNAEITRYTATKDSDYRDFLHFNYEFEGKQKENIFAKVYEELETLLIYYSQSLDTLEAIIQQYYSVLEIEKEINENIFLVEIRNKVFNQQNLEAIEYIGTKIQSNKHEIENWLLECRTLYNYEMKFHGDTA